MARKKLLIKSSLEYDPLREYSKTGSCTMKCPVGECIIEIELKGSLKNVIQVLNITGETLTLKGGK